MGAWRLAVVSALTSVAALLVLPATAGSDHAGGGDDPIRQLGDRFVPRPAGTVEELDLYYGPYTIPPGHDMNRVDLELPVGDAFVMTLDPSLRTAGSLHEPSHQHAHIHHAHWLALDHGNEEDNYTSGFTEWRFGTGDEETMADSRPRTDAEPNGPVYGGYVDAGRPQTLVYMIHNKSAEPLVTYLVLHTVVKHGTPEELSRLAGRAHHPLTGVIFGRTFDVPRQPEGDGIFENAVDDPQGVIEWKATKSGTIIGMGAHLHPGGLDVLIENYGTPENPCPATNGGYGGTKLFRSEAISRNARFSEDFQMTVTQPAWRAPIRKGDRLRVSGAYENRDHAWYQVMSFGGMYFDTKQPPRPGCKPYLVGQPQTAPRSARLRRKARRMRRTCRRRYAGASKRVRARRRACYRRVKRRTRARRPDPTQGVPNRPWSGPPEPFCGEAFGAPPCERPERNVPTGYSTSQVMITNFLYYPGDQSLSGQAGAPVQVKRGTSLTFLNADQPANIRHTVTTCPWPCNGPYVANYPLADGRWDSGTLGYDVVDGGRPSPVASTPPDLPVGKYAYFCRIHPWMRGAFEVVP